jgi:hypothetical protein
MQHDRHPSIPARSVDKFHGPEGVQCWVARSV